MSATYLSPYGTLTGALRISSKTVIFLNIITKYDILLFNETWTNKYSPIDLPNYRVFSKHRVKKARAARESGGICVYIHSKFERGFKEENWDFEDGLCIRMDGTFFGWDKDIYLLCVYMRATNSSREDLIDDVNCYDILEDKLVELRSNGHPVLLCGDMNARTKNNGGLFLL